MLMSPRSGRDLGSALWEHPFSSPAIILVLRGTTPRREPRAVICERNASADLPSPCAAGRENQLPTSARKERAAARGRAGCQAQPAPLSPPETRGFCRPPLITIYNVNNPPDFPRYRS